jgi:hypothetical protein
MSPKPGNSPRRCWNGCTKTVRVTTCPKRTGLCARSKSTLVPLQGPGNDVELHYPNAELGIVLYMHDRGVILFFPYMAYSIYSRVVLGICYTYMHYLYDVAGFWNFDPQLNILSYGGDYQTLERTAVLMDRVMPRMLTS